MIIQDEQLQGDVIQALADPIDSRIMRYLSLESRSVTSISEYLELSSSTTYRRLKNLELQGIIYVERAIDPETHKPINRYRGSFSHIEIVFNGALTKVEVVSNRKVVEKTHQLFSAFKKGGL